MSNNSPWIISGSGSSGGTISIAAASQNTISLTSLSLNDIDNFKFEFNDNVKKYEVYEISQDLLALSVCWARLRTSKVENQPFISITKLLDSDLFRLVTEDDIVQANVIRDYYSKKIMVWRLKNIKLTQFREDMNTFIHSDGKTFKENMMPLAYRLPEFYEYDIEFEKMSFEYNKEVKRQESIHVIEKKHLTFIKSLSVNTKRLKKIEYWFSDNHNNLVQLNVETSNPLHSLLEKVITGGIELVGRYGTRNRDGYEFLKVEKYKFI
jgi:hypothetical protein